MARTTRCLVAVMALSVAAMVGCTSSRVPRGAAYWAYPHAHEPTLTQTSGEHFHAVGDVAARDARGLIDDLDLLFQSDRPNRLSRWHSR